MNKNNPFKTPEGYFDSLKDRLMDAASEQQADLPGKEGFKVPEGYFDNLKGELMGKVSKNEPKVVALFQYRKIFYATAAAAAVVLLVFGLQYRGETQPSFEDLASADIEHYLENNAADLNTYEIVSELGIEEIEFGDVMDNELEEENIIDYLDESIDDLEDLNFEYDE